MNTLDRLTESASEYTKQAKQSVEDFSRSAGKRMDEARGDTGEALHSAAASVRETGRKGSKAIHDAANGTAEHLDASGSYVENHDLRDIFAGMLKFGRRHVTGSVVAAAAVGFLAGSALSRASHSCAKSTDEA